MRRASSALLASALRAGQAATSTACWRPASTAASAASVRLEDAALPPPAFIVGAARPPPTPLDLAAAVEKVQFDESVDATFCLGTDPRRGDQAVRGAVALPFGTGKAAKVAVFADGADADAAREAGADVVGGADLAAEYAAGGGAAVSGLDRCLATPALMPALARAARVLGPRGLMPSPKAGTVITGGPAALAAAVASAKRGGDAAFRADKGGVVAAPIGRRSFPPDQLAANFGALAAALLAARPRSLKGGGGGVSGYIMGAHLSSTMGPGVPVAVAAVAAAAASAQASKKAGGAPGEMRPSLSHATGTPPSTSHPLMMPSTTGRGRTGAPASPPSSTRPTAAGAADARHPLSPGALYEAERAARIAANEARMAQVLDAKPAGLAKAAAAGKAPKPNAPKRTRPAHPADAPDAPPLRRSTRDRRPMPPAGSRSRVRGARLADDDDDEEEGDDDAPYSPGLTREERLARLEGDGGLRHWAPWAGDAIPALAQRGGSTNKALLADAGEVRALSVYRADRMTIKGVANRVDKLTNRTKLEDFVPVLREKAAAALAAGEEEEALEYDRVADIAEAKLAQMAADRE